MRKTKYNPLAITRAKQWARKARQILYKKPRNDMRTKVGLMLSFYLLSKDMTWTEVAHKFGYEDGKQARAQVLRSIT